MTCATNLNNGTPRRYGLTSSSNTTNCNEQNEVLLKRFSSFINYQLLNISSNKSLLEKTMNKIQQITLEASMEFNFLNCNQESASHCVTHDSNASTPESLQFDQNIISTSKDSTITLEDQVAVQMKDEVADDSKKSSLASTAKDNPTNGIEESKTEDIDTKVDITDINSDDKDEKSEIKTEVYELEAMEDYVEGETNLGASIIYLKDETIEDNSLEETKKYSMEDDYDESKSSGAEDSPRPSLPRTMPRPYIRKRNRPRDEEALKLAFLDVKSGALSQRQAAKKFNIAKSTLADYLTRDKKHQCGFKMRSYSNSQIFSKELETLLVEYLLKCSAMFHGLSRKSVRRLAYEYAMEKNVSIPNQWKENESAGKEWLTGFMNRNKALALRTPEATGLARMTIFNRINVGIFQKKLEEVIRHYHFEAGDIYNLDETGCTTGQKTLSVIARKGAHQIGEDTSRERGEVVTMVGIVCANGNALPPCFIFPRVRFDEKKMLSGASVGCKGFAYLSGWMTSQKIFLHVLKHIVHQVRCSLEHKVLLIMDNHESHLSLEGINYAKENGIVILTLPPHTSMKLQPLERTVYGPFKTFYKQGISSWLLQNPGRPITIYELAPIMCTAWDRAASPTNIKSGFRCTGISPFDRGIITEEDFLMSCVTGRTAPSISPETTRNIEEPSTSSLQPQSDLVSPKLIRPFAKAPPQKESTRGLKRGKCMIATDTPEKLLIEEKEKTTKKIKQNGKKIVKRQIKFAELNKSSSDEDDALLEINDSSEYSDEYAASVNESIVIDKVPEVNDFVLVSLTPIKGQCCHYVGQIKSILMEENEYEISYLRMAKKFGDNIFLFPQVSDESTVEQRLIVGVLPKPIPQSSKRMNGVYKFSLSFSGYNMR